jgi:hypothetical protein
VAAQARVTAAVARGFDLVQADGWALHASAKIPQLAGEIDLD